MKNIGKIKWFGGRSSKNNREIDYGFIIKDDDKQEIYFHENDIFLKKDSIFQGLPVSFQISKGIKGKNVAKKIQNLKDETDTEIIELSLNSNEFDIWSIFLKSHIEKLNKDEQDIFIRSKINLIAEYEIRKLSEIITDNAILIRYDDLFNCLTFDKKIIVILDHLERNELFDNIEFSRLIELIEEYEYSFQFTDICNKIPSKFLIKGIEHLEKIKPINRIIFYAKIVNDYYSQILSHIGDFSTLTLKVKECILEISNFNEWSLFPEVFLKQKLFFEILPMDLKLTVNFEEISSGKIWNDLNFNEKVKSIFKASKEFNDLSIKSDSDKIINSMLNIFNKKDASEQERYNLFLDFHNNFQDFVLETAFNSDEPLNFFGLLPKCPNHIVDYCEGRFWPTQEDVSKNIKTMRAFCPRANCSCGVKTSLHWGGFSGAKLYPNMNSNWQDWSIIEFFEFFNIIPNIQEINRMEDYYLKLSGWINRLNEIRSRLKCSICKSIMIPNAAYAKNLARYNVTIVSCEKGRPHDFNIYLNHCWACHKIIDSREDKIQVEGYYICLNCASGPQNSQTYTQGSICAKCGSTNVSINGRTANCNVCTHIMNLPRENLITGLRNTFPTF